MGTDTNLKVDGKILSNQETVADILADHFAMIARCQIKKLLRN